MNKKHFYEPPKSEVIHLEAYCALLHTSFEDDNGNGHGSAGDDGQDLSAIQTWFDYDDEEEFND